MNGLREDVEIRYEGRGRLKRRTCDGPPPLPRNDLLHLPQEIMLNILSRLPVESVLKCRLVCKTWSSLPLLHDNTYFADMHLRRQQQQLQLRRPFQHDYVYHHQHNNSNADTNKLSFVFMGCKKSLYYVEYDENDEQSYRTHRKINLPLPNDKLSLVGSCNGLICLSVELKTFYDPVYIYNPITREFVHLPRVIMNNKHESVKIAHGFGYHPSTHEYKVVRVYYCLDQPPYIGQVQVYTLGSGIGWRNKGEITHVLRPTAGSHAILVNGALHWVSMEGYIVAFDLADEEFRCPPMPPCSSPISYENSNLWVLDGWLCFVHQREYSSADIWLLKKKKSASSYDMKEQVHQSWSWSREFTIAIKEIQFMHQPFAITKSGEILLWYNWKSIVCCDPKTTSKPKKLGDLHKAIIGIQAIAYHSSFVSLKALR
ncbi:F-box domain [Macleaya cordata]|uniref:F-box domain n=1 Tax=Macleaya cordata TaxID=56857 RepID=A0A200R1A7_MACCD|nr:F-box domain [Macleaya cordata]